MRYVVLLCVLFVLPGWSAPAKHVLLISIDGLRPDALQSSETPTLHTLMKRGSYSLRARTVYPSVTLTSHVSMMTGVMPAKHGVLWNEWEPARGAVEANTCFDVAHAAGLTTAMVAGKEKFRHFVKGDRLTEFRMPGYMCADVADAAADFIVSAKPALIMVHLAEPDGAGHAKGWLTPEYFDAIARSDQAVARLLRALDEAGIAASTAVIVSADHGGHDRTHGSMLDEDMLIPWIASGAGIKVAGELTVPIYTVDTAATVVLLLGLTPPAEWDGKPVQAALATGPAPSPVASPAR